LPPGIPEEWPTGAHLVVLGAEGADAAVESHVAEMERACKEMSGQVSSSFSPPYHSLVSALTSLGYPNEAGGPSLLVRINLPPGETLRCLAGIQNVRAGLGVIPATAVHVAAGIAYVRFSKSGAVNLEGTPEKIVQALARLHRTSLIVLGVTESSGNTPFILGNRTPASWLRAIKKCFDPDGLMNPSLLQW
jgi:FAD/FMN-containing dehydrogenase